MPKRIHTFIIRGHFLRPVIGSVGQSLIGANGSTCLLNSWLKNNDSFDNCETNSNIPPSALSTRMEANELGSCCRSWKAATTWWLLISRIRLHTVWLMMIARPSRIFSPCFPIRQRNPSSCINYLLIKFWFTWCHTASRCRSTILNTDIICLTIPVYYMKWDSIIIQKAVRIRSKLTLITT